MVPSLVHDMAHPETEFNSTIDTAYIIAFVATLVTASAGYLMYGDSVSSEITRDLIKTGPAWLNRAALYAIALSPIVKYALASAPLTVTIEHLIGVRGPTVVLNDGSSVPVHPPTPPPPTLMAHLRRPLITALVVVLAIVIPDFELVLSFLGSCSSFLICAIGPIGGASSPSLRIEVDHNSVPHTRRRRSGQERHHQAWFGNCREMPLLVSPRHLVRHGHHRNDVRPPASLRLSEY